MPMTKGKADGSYGAVEGSTETSSLLSMKPSPNSTDLPSGQDHKYQGETKTLLEVGGPSIDDPDENKCVSLVGKNRRILVGSVLVGLIGFLTFAFSWHQILPGVSPLGGGSGFDIRHHVPLSTLHPVDDLGLTDIRRPKASRPQRALIKGAAAMNGTRAAFPTNAWYQNLLMMDGEPSNIHRAYPMPFLVDVAGPIAGLRVHPNHIQASTSVVQLNIIENYGLTVGAAADATTTKKNDMSTTKGYVIENMTPLGVTLGWESYPMSSSIVKGMPYGTMRFDKMKHTAENGEKFVPTVFSEMGLASKAIVDGKKELKCSAKDPSIVKVEREVEFHFKSSDFTWLVFVSKPVSVQCVLDEDTDLMQLQVVGSDSKNESDTDEEEDSSPFFIRIALSKLCSTNMNPIYCHQEQMSPYSLNLGQGRYDDVLRNHSHLIPGPDTSFEYAVDQSKEQILLTFDWDVIDMTDYYQRPTTNGTDSDLLVFALPHHLDLLGTDKAPGYLKYCASTLIGPACLLSGSSWNMIEKLPNIAFRAPRPPAPWAISQLAESLSHDLHYTLPKYFRHGIGDTYFSGKMLAKLARILVVAEEVKELCDDETPSQSGSNGYEDVCENVSLPSDEDIADAVATLRSSVEIWINGTAVTPFVFDSAWGGVVSCGCDFNGTICKNKFPDCPAFTDPGLNFGNGFYNDLHFHYGYHIYGAAVVAHFDAEWGKKMFDRVLLLVRNIANPTTDDEFFPTFRMKDWYQGHSWASGIVSPVFLNGRNQESSSESIAGYEAVAMYGAVMTSIWEKEKSPDNMERARAVHEAGQLLTVTEIRSVRRYYHVRDNNNENEALKIYPSEYNHHAIGMLWSTMAQYQTWFGSAPYLAIGIQLLPLTPIAEQRDGLQWTMEMYPSLAESCRADKVCTDNGWSVLQLGILATVGHPESAAKVANGLANSVFTSAGGNGHSLSNTLWYLSTRPAVDKPLALLNKTSSNETGVIAKSVHVLTDCTRPETCTDYVLDTVANEYTCRQRMTWLMDIKGHTEADACFVIAGVQFPAECAACNPNATDTSEDFVAQCPPCTTKQCQSELNRCPSYPQTFVCTDGMSQGGCSSLPWDTRGAQCDHCCELSECPQTTEESSCPLCTRRQCRSSVNTCGKQSLSPFLCVDGPSKSSCSVQPWPLDNGQCDTCCKVVPGCDQ